jgi:tetratricopeptide (TPR) repeat protein
MGVVAVAGLAYLLWTHFTFGPLRDGEAAYEAGNYRAALRVAYDSLKERPHDRRAAFLAARCLARLGFSAQAEEYYQRAGALATGLLDLHERAFALARGEHPERALAVYQEILTRSPDDLLAIKRLSAVHMARKQWKQVLALAERLVAISGGEAAGQTLSAIGHHELNHYEQAVTAGERVLEIDPELKEMPLPSGLFWNNLALDLVAQGKTSEAESYLKRALRGTEDANLMELLGLTYFQQGSADRAEECWLQAVQWDPRNADALLGLGRLALNRNQAGEAVKWLERAAEASPEALEPVYNLGRACRLLGRTADAERYERRAAVVRASRTSSRGMGEMPDPQTGQDPPAGDRQGTSR